MKVLFTREVILEIVNNGKRSGDCRAVLNACQEKKISGYICGFVLLELAEKLSPSSAKEALSILTGLLKVVHVSVRDMQTALKERDFEKGLIRATTLSHRLDCSLVLSKSEQDHSKIRMYVPEELKRLIENGKTGEQTGNLQGESDPCRKG